MFTSKPFQVGDTRSSAFKFVWSPQASRKGKIKPVLKMASKPLSMNPPQFSFQTNPSHPIQAQTSQRHLQLPQVLLSTSTSISLPQETFITHPPSGPWGVDLFFFIHSSHWDDMNGMPPTGPGKMTVFYRKELVLIWGTALSNLKEHLM